MYSIDLEEKRWIRVASREGAIPIRIHSQKRADPIVPLLGGKLHTPLLWLEYKWIRNKKFSGDLKPNWIVHVGIEKLGLLI